MFIFFSSRRRHTICALVTGVQTCALPIFLIASWRSFRTTASWRCRGEASLGALVPRANGTYEKRWRLASKACPTSTTATKIGRASCRERVGQYGQISVVAVRLKKNKNDTQHYNKMHTHDHNNPRYI